MKRFAAEVNMRLFLLIVLAILVLIMGIGRLIGFVGKCVIKYNIKNSYMEFSRILDLMNLESGGGNACYYSTNVNVPSQSKDCGKFYKKFATAVKLSKYCKSDALSGGCVPKYEEYSVDKNCIGFSEQMINKFDQTFVLQDGEIISVYNYGQNNPMPIFALDVNGKFPPNRAGQDWFTFIIMRNANGDYFFNQDLSFCMPEPKGETYIKNISELEN
ncbi:MAG: hypothetical protein LKG27_03730 [Clostridiaceae bacterium]|jgi:hypothetical protein|nr:hypothetical protein [Clostridiaceae bacterium]